MRRLFLFPVSLVVLVLLAAFAVGVFGGVGSRPASADNIHGGSVRVAIVVGPGFGTDLFAALPTTSGVFGSQFTFVNLPVGNLSLASLTTTTCGGNPCDTLVLNFASVADIFGDNCVTLPVPQRVAINAFAAAGGKVIIYDSECKAVNYTWLTFPFQSTRQRDGNQCTGLYTWTLTIDEENILSTSTPTTDPHYINTGAIATCPPSDAVWDRNIAIDRDTAWCLDMTGKTIDSLGNVYSSGVVHMYAKSGPNGGLFIYNGLDMDYIRADTTPNNSSGVGALAKIWLQELEASAHDLPGCCAPAPGAMAAWWPLDEKKGDGTILDISGGVHNGTPNPGPFNANMFGAGMVGGAFTLGVTPADGTMFVEVPGDALEPIAYDFSIDAWVYPVTPNPNVPGVIQPIVDKWDPAFNNNNGKGYAFYIQSPGIANNARLTFRYSDGTVAGSSTVQSYVTLDYDKWSHVAVTFRRPNAVGSDIDILLYINGQPKGHQTGGSIGTIANLKNLLIGGTQQLPLPTLGEIALDEVEIFHTAVPQADIAAIYDAGSAGKCKGGGGGGGVPRVGGIVELRADGADPSALAASDSGSPEVPHAALVGSLAVAAAAALIAGGWYARRRWLR